MVNFIYAILILLRVVSIDPEFLIGSWEITKSQSLENLVLSSAYQYSDEDLKERINRLSKLALDSTYYRFTEDSVFWSDVNQHEEKVVHLKGRWLLKGDTVFIFKPGRVEPFSYKIEKKSNDILSLRFIFPDGKIAKSRRDFQRTSN